MHVEVASGGWCGCFDVSLLRALSRFARIVVNALYLQIMNTAYGQPQMLKESLKRRSERLRSHTESVRANLDLTMCDGYVSIGYPTPAFTTCRNEVINPKLVAYLVMVMITIVRTAPS